MEKKIQAWEPGTRSLVKCLTKFQDDDKNFQLCVDFALSNFMNSQHADVDYFKVKKKLKGLIQKFNAKAEHKKTAALSDLQDQFYDTVSTETSDMKYTSFGILLLLTELCGLGDIYDSKLDFTSKISVCASEKETVNWAEYLCPKMPEDRLPSDEDSSCSDSEDEDSLENSMHLHYKPLPTTDSGIEVSPDSVVSIFPVLMPFQPLQDIEPEEPPNLLRPYWNSQYQNARNDLGLCNVDSNFTNLWMKHLDELYPASNTNTTLTEVVMLREILWMLHGVKDTFVFKFIDGKFQLTKHIQFGHLTENTLRNLLLPLCEYGNKKVEIENFIFGVCNSNSSTYCSTIQAYATGISHILTEYSSTLTNFEKKIIDRAETITLIQLIHKLKPHIEKLEFLYDMHTEIYSIIIKESRSWKQSLLVLDLEWKKILELSIWTNDSSLLSMVLFIFLMTYRAYFKILESYLVLGQPIDFYSEFMVDRCFDFRVSDSEFWKSGLQLRVPMPYNFFMNSLCDDILMASKSMAIINELKSHSCESYGDTSDIFFERFLIDFQTLYESLHPVIVQNVSMPEEKNEYDSGCGTSDQSEKYVFDYQLLNEAKRTCLHIENHQKLCHRTADIIKLASLFPLSMVIQQSLFPCIRNACSSQNKKLIEILKNEHCLLKHMSVLKKYFFMESGDVMFTFYSKIFGEILDERSWHDVACINFALKAAIAADNNEVADRLTIDVNDQIVFNPHQPLRQIEMLNLTYQVEWPVNIVLNPDCQQRCNQIFCFLMQVKCAKHKLDELYFTTLLVKTQRVLSQLPKTRMAKQRIFYGMHILRMKLLHFVNGFHNYLMSRILHSFGVELDESMSNAGSLEEILEIHNRYLTTVQERCLLTPKLPYLREQILRVLGLTLNFQNIWKSGVDIANIEEVKHVEDEFSSCVNFLMSYLSKPLKRARNLHLDALASAILSDSHVERMFT